MKIKKYLISIIITICMIFEVMPVTALAATAGDGTYTWPVSVNYSITGNWYYSNGDFHGATDFGVPIGTPVYATAAGTVITAKDVGCTGSHNGSAYAPVCNKLGLGCPGRYGNYIVIDHGNNVYSWYCHLSTGRLNVSVGQKVSQGQLIGYSGNAGNTKGAHLHFEMRMGGNSYGGSYKNDPGNRVDPQKYLTKKNVTPISDPPTYSDFWISQKLYDTSETVSITAIASNATTYTVGIDKEGVGRVVTQTSGSTYTIPASQLGVGRYSVYMTVANSAGYVDTKRMEFIITEKCNLGDTFSARIQNQGTGCYVTDRNSNVYGSSEDGSKEQIWKFTRQSDGSYSLMNQNDGLFMDDSYIDDPPAGANVHIWEQTGNWNQHFNIYYLNDGYFIRPANSTNLVLDMGAGDPYNVAIWPFAENATQQKFNIKKIDSIPTYSDFWTSQKLYDTSENVSVTAVAFNAETYVVGIDKEGTGRIITEVTNSTYTIPASQLGVGRYSVYMTLANSIGSVDTKRMEFIITEKCNLGDKFSALIQNQGTGYYVTDRNCNVYGSTEDGSDEQVWEFTRQSDGSYTLMNRNDGLYMDDSYINDPPAGANVHIWEGTGNWNQHFNIYYLNDAYFIRPANSTNLVLDMGAGDPYNVAIWPFAEDATQQKFDIEKIDIGEPLDTAYFNGHKYELYGESMTWKSAEKFCKRKGGYLVTITSEEENAFVNTLRAKSLEADLEHNIWLGASDEKTEGVWTWCTNEAFFYVNWKPGEPNGKEKQNYMQMFSDGTWDDVQNEVARYVVCEYSIIDDTPLNVKIGGRAGDALRLNWNKNDKASGYIIDQYKNGSWTRIARIGNNATTTYRVEKLVPSTTYQFRIQAFAFDGNTPVYGKYTYINGKTNPAIISGAKIGGRAGDALRLNWNKDSKASGYIIEQYKNGSWTRIARIGSNATTTYRVERLSPSTTYKFRVQSFGFDGNTALYGNYGYVSGKTNPAIISGLKIGGTANDALRLNWNKDSKASGYIIEQYKNGKWIRIARIGSNTTTTYRVEKLQSKTTYKFRVQSFGFDGSTALYGSYSYVCGVTR